MPLQNNFVTLARELMVAIRDDCTQAQINEALKSKQNKVAKWESGHHKIYWRNFCALAEICKVDVTYALKQHLAYNGVSSNCRAIFRHLCRDATAKDICARLNCSRASFTRWSSGQSQVPMWVLMSLMEFAGRLTSFMEQIVDLNKLPSMHSLHGIWRSAREVFAVYPEAAAFLCFIESKQYADLSQHKPGLFADVFEISKSREEELMRALEQAKLIERDSGKYRPLTYHTNVAYTAAENFACMQKVRMYWLKRGHDMQGRDCFDRSQCLGGHEVFSSNEEIREKIQEEILFFRQRVHQILEQAAGPTDEVCVMQYQLMNLSRPWST